MPQKYYERWTTIPILVTNHHRGDDTLSPTLTIDLRLHLNQGVLYDTHSDLRDGDIMIFELLFFSLDFGLQPTGI
jgi:hypothetical protein